MDCGGNLWKRRDLVMINSKGNEPLFPEQLQCPWHILNPKTDDSRLFFHQRPPPLCRSEDAENGTMSKRGVTKIDAPKDIQD
jgi:hypothetical protein